MAWNSIRAGNKAIICIVINSCVELFLSSSCAASFGLVPPSWTVNLRLLISASKFNYCLHARFCSLPMHRDVKSEILMHIWTTNARTRTKKLSELNGRMEAVRKKNKRVEKRCWTKSQPNNSFDIFSHALLSRRIINCCSWCWRTFISVWQHRAALCVANRFPLRQHSTASLLLIERERGAAESKHNHQNSEARERKIIRTWYIYLEIDGCVPESARCSAKNGNRFGNLNHRIK